MMSRKSPVNTRASTSTKIMQDSDSEEDFYSNFVAKQSKNRKPEATPKLEDKLTIPIPKFDEGEALRSLDSDDSLGSGNEDTDFMEKLRKKAELGRLEKEKKLEKERNELDSLSKDEYRSGSGFVDRLSCYDKIINDVTRIRHVRKGRFDRNARTEQSFGLDEETPNIKRAKKERCFIQIMDLDDPCAKHPLISLEMTEPFSNIRRILAEKKECSMGCIHLSKGLVDIRDDQTPIKASFEPEEIYELQCLVIRGNTTIALKCHKKGSGPLTIHAEKTDTFSEISKQIRDKGVDFDKIIFDSTEIPLDETPETFKLQEDDILDLI